MRQKKGSRWLPFDRLLLGAVHSAETAERHTGKLPRGRAGTGVAKKAFLRLQLFDTTVVGEEKELAI